MVAWLPWQGRGSRFARTVEEQAAWLTRHSAQSTVATLLLVTWWSIVGIARRVVPQSSGDATIDLPPLGRLPILKAAMPMDPFYEYDFFLSHASEDRADFADPLRRALEEGGAKVWYSPLTLQVGRNLRLRIEEGLRKSRFTIILLSPAYLAKPWPLRELDAVVASGTDVDERMLPVLHHLTVEQVLQRAPTVARLVMLNSDSGADVIASSLLKRLADSGGGGQLTTDAGPNPTLATVRSRLTPGFTQVPNGRAYMVLDVIATPSVTTSLSEEAFEVVEGLVTRIRPDAKCKFEDDQYINWSDREVMGSYAWVLEVKPGPAIRQLQEADLVPLGHGQALRLQAALSWWLVAAEAASHVLGRLGGDQAAVSFGLNPYPPGSSPVIGIEFGDAPAARRSAEYHQIPPWMFSATPVASDEVSGELPLALEDLLKIFNYRSAPDLIGWIRTQVEVARTASFSIAPDS